MTITHANLELVARAICDSRNGAGHYDAKGTHRAHWLELARVGIEHELAIGTADALMAIFGFRRLVE